MLRQTISFAFVACVAACTPDTTAVAPTVGASVHFVSVTASSTTIMVGDTAHFVAREWDAQSKLLTNRTVAWTSSDTAVLHVTNAGVAIGVAPGAASVIAESEGIAAAAAVTVIPAPIATIALTPNQLSIAVGGTAQVIASVTTSHGGAASTHTTWTSSNNLVATVSSTGFIVGINPGTATIKATADTVSASVVVKVNGSVAFSALVTGELHTCGLSTGGVAYCWGKNESGELGNGDFPASSSDRTRPVAVVGDRIFSALTSSSNHTCALAANGAAYCWGFNTVGQLGDATPSHDSRRSPIAVVGGLSFVALSAGDQHTCGVATGGAAFCWGMNMFGELGGGPDLGGRFCQAMEPCLPVAVAGSQHFTSLSAGQEHTCGLNTNGVAFCWGANYEGRLGDGTTIDHNTPVAVLGGLTFTSLVSGWYYTCGVTTSGAAYCWGDNQAGELGDGTTEPRTSPVLVSGGLTFASLAAGGYHTCGVTTTGAAYCWGENGYGALGDGASTSDFHLVPAPVSGGIVFTSLAAGSEHTCGVAMGGAAYCWGFNLLGQLGDSTTVNRSAPTLVKNP